MTTYTTPSGLGGTFTVKIIEELGGDRVKVKTHMPRNPDWHGFAFTTTRDKLAPEFPNEGKRFQVWPPVAGRYWVTDTLTNQAVDSHMNRQYAEAHAARLNREERRAHLTRHCEAFAALDAENQDGLLLQLDRGEDMDVVIRRAYDWMAQYAMEAEAESAEALANERDYA